MKGEMHFFQLFFRLLMKIKFIIRIYGWNCVLFSMWNVAVCFSVWYDALLRRLWQRRRRRRGLSCVYTQCMRMLNAWESMRVEAEVYMSISIWMTLQPDNDLIFYHFQISLFFSQTLTLDFHWNWKWMKLQQCFRSAGLRLCLNRVVECLLVSCPARVSTSHSAGDLIWPSIYPLPPVGQHRQSI